MSSIIQVGTKLAFAVLLLFSVLLEVVILPTLAGEALAGAGADQGLLPAVVAWGVLVALPCQVMILVAWRLTSLARDEHIFSATSHRLVSVLVTLPFITAVLLLAGFVAASILGYTPPIVMFGLLGAMAFALAFGLILITMRELLVRATALSTEMKQVV